MSVNSWLLHACRFCQFNQINRSVSLYTYWIYIYIYINCYSRFEGEIICLIYMFNSKLMTRTDSFSFFSNFPFHLFLQYIFVLLRPHGNKVNAIAVITGREGGPKGSIFFFQDGDHGNLITNELVSSETYCAFSSCLNYSFLFICLLLLLFSLVQVQQF